MPPLRPGHSDEVRKKNIEEMVSAGHDPREAVGAAYANQRKYKKMAEGGLMDDQNGSIEQEEIEGQTLDPHRGLFDLQEDSHLAEHLSEVPEHHEMLAHALGEREHYSMSGESKMPTEMEQPSQVVSMPESHFAEEARKAIAKRKKDKLIKTDDEGEI